MDKRKGRKVIHDRELATLWLPVIIQESILPLSGSVKIASREYTDGRGEVSVSVQGGVYRGESLNLPSGAIARKLLHYLVSRSRETKSRRVDFHSVGEVLRNLGMAKSAQNLAKIKEQIMLISRMTITIDKYPHHDRSVLQSYPNIRIIKKLELHGMGREDQGSLFGSWVEFDTEFFEMISGLNHQPINKDAYQSLSAPLHIDAYLWIQRRAQSNTVGPEGHDVISWENVYRQFGRGEQLSKFKKRFTNSVKAVDKVLRRDPWDYTPDYEGKSKRGRPKRFVWTNDDGVCLRRIPRQAFTRDQLYKMDPSEYQEIKVENEEVKEQGNLFKSSDD